MCDSFITTTAEPGEIPAPSFFASWSLYGAGALFLSPACRDDHNGQHQHHQRRGSRPGEDRRTPGGPATAPDRPKLPRSAREPRSLARAVRILSTGILPDAARAVISAVCRCNVTIPGKAQNAPEAPTIAQNAKRPSRLYRSPPRLFLSLYISFFFL